MATALIPVMRTQLHLVWSLLEHGLHGLTDEDCQWTPVADERTATVRRDASGAWVADWSGVESQPYPIATIAWLTWHIGWWWTTILAHLSGAPVPDRVDVAWPGGADAATVWLADLHSRWLVLLDTLTDDDLAKVAPFLGRPARIAPSLTRSPGSTPS